MEAVIGLLVMILGVSHGVETSCDGRQDGAQCYGALGGTVVLRLMDSASEIFRYHWSTKTTRILYGRKNLIVSNEIENRSSFTPSDGTFRINNLSWNDDGVYKLTIYDSNGMISEQRTLHLSIQGEETSCDGRQDGAQCYGALGGTVVLRLMDSASEIFRYHWSTKTTRILYGRKDLIVSNEIENRSSFTPSDGTFRINNLSWSDEGEYTLEIYDSDGRITEQRTLQLTIQGVETSCDGRQDGAQCYGALGGTVVLRLMDNASEIYRYHWSTKTTTILDGRKNLIVSNEIENRSSFTPSDGTFRVNNLSWNDGGEYKLRIFSSNGRISEQRTLHLSIQAPVSSVLLVSECLSQGEMRVSCSSEGGDSPQYSWTLDGHTLTDAELLSGNTETTNITLKQHVSGQLVCSVRNKVSSISTCGFTFINCPLPYGMRMSQWIFSANNTLCIEPTTAPTTIPETEASTVDHSLLICGVRAAVVILALIGICVFFAWKKKKYKMAAGSGVHCERGHEENSVMMVELPVEGDRV
ncbi:pregnancy-specific glycoprotein 22 isoform X7 [Epinephelus moara]|uniref:pregnancy-specific glycoprotein 22 isoform X7 n=1 Tax=Epinephelus moara TaxID=300413 RepID=UPI00214F4535|nr:pregnancy-specific glycoprotein 22 isoform X7 [Epinephelus moara]